MSPRAMAHTIAASARAVLESHGCKVVDANGVEMDLAEVAKVIGGNAAGILAIADEVLEAELEQEVARG